LADGVLRQEEKCEVEIGEHEPSEHHVDSVVNQLNSEPNFLTERVACLVNLIPVHQRIHTGYQLANFDEII
jgi:DNA polymerase IIIc chi subunit